MSLLSQKNAGYHKIQFAFNINSSSGGGGCVCSSSRKRVSGSVMVPYDMKIFIVPLCLCCFKMRLRYYAKHGIGY
jgi:hypothetical protein